MIGFRPKPSALFLERPRLLRLLPEEPGYVVWLEAPYGYGKSVLVSQWASRLEADKWRVLWLALVDGDPREPLALALGLAESAPWTAVLTALAKEKTLVILEDLENDPEVGASLGPLLKYAQGLVLLASRKRLRTPELLRTRTEGRLIHLQAEHLAFTPQEATALFGDRDASQAWQKTRGWSLPLHMAALTGELPDEESLWDGVRESLEVEEWREVLFLCALPYLPDTAADANTFKLSSLGFVQALESGFRLHPLAAEAVLAHHADGVRDAVSAGLERLPVGLQAEACARSGLLEKLHVLLENPDLARQDSVGVMRWHALCAVQNTTELNPKRLLTLSWAYSVTGQHEAAMAAYLGVARHPDATPNQRLEALGWALFDLQPTEFDQADGLFAEAQPWLERVTEHSRAVFLTNGATFYIEARRWAEAESLLERAVPLIRPERRQSGIINLALVRWELHGNLLGHLEQLQASLESPDYFPFNRAGSVGWVARIHALLGETELALQAFAQLEGMSEHNPVSALVGRIEAAALQGKLAAFPALEREAEAQNAPTQGEEHPLGLVRAHWARCLREAGRIQEAHGMLEETFKRLDTPFLRVEMALCLHDLKRTQRALEILAPALEATQRWSRMLALAARYRITRKLAHLETLLRVTDAGARILPKLVELKELPKNRSENASAYPIKTVLHSGWPEAILQRHADIPPLELRVLGGLEVRLLGEPVSLTARPKDIIALLALRLPRERIAEILWPEADAEKSRNNLHVNLNALRKALEPWGVTTHLLETGLTRARVDLWDLEEALRAGRIDAVRSLYAELLPGFDLEAIEEARSGLHKRVFQAVLDHAAGLETSQPQAAEDALEWLLSRDPTHEAAFAGLLNLMLRSGRRVSAQRRYLEFADRLRREFGLEPAPEMRLRLA